MLSIVVEKEKVLSGYILIDNSNDIKHIVNVYRLNVGEKLRVVDGTYEYITSITKISKKEILVKIENKKEDIYSLNVNIDVAMALIKNDKMNLLIQKITEIGVRKIIPIKTERVVVKIDSKKEKWDDIVKETMKQCRAVVKTEIEQLVDIKKLDFAPYDKVIFLYENSIKQEKIIDVVDKTDKNILCIIGSEGGFTENEVKSLQEKGAIEISLGKRILRAETAAINIVAILAHIYGY